MFNSLLNWNVNKYLQVQLVLASACIQFSLFSRRIYVVRSEVWMRMKGLEFCIIKFYIRRQKRSKQNQVAHIQASILLSCEKL